MSLRLYNTMGRKMEEFIPIHQGKVGFYGCGPTVYNYAHIGNLRAYIFLDILDKTLSYLGYDITHVMNVTDIGHLSGDSDDGEDKMVKTAKERGQSVLEIAQFYTDAFFNDIDRLNIRRPDVICKATEHVQDMIDLIKRIEANGHTYMSGGNLYFDVSTFPDYGKLACLNLDDLKAGARIDIDQNKKNPFDFVLWFTKSKFENQALNWDSPWGRGYPGWHIECSAMSMKYLGEQIDIHTGGIDHIPIHHTNEIAQSEGATGKKWVNYWLHNEFLVIAKDKDSKEQEGKMSKSSGNFLTLQSLIDKGYDPLDYRFFLLGAHYRSQVAFSWVAMDGAKNARKALLQRLAKIIDQNQGKLPDSHVALDNPELLPYLEKFKAALENDLATPQALSALQTLIKNNSLQPQEILGAVAKMDLVLSLNLLNDALEIYKTQQQQVTSVNNDEDPEAQEIQALIEERTTCKKAKNFERADEIRNQLKERGIVIEDTPNGPIWKRI
ncbi:MAG: cysteine--tRNA ligase [Spirochaetaceae bacterium]|nr:cysteine--tRNA ligase [Spirochaetaceae bacterium]